MKVLIFDIVAVLADPPCRRDDDYEEANVDENVYFCHVLWVYFSDHFSRQLAWGRRAGGDSSSPLPTQSDTTPAIPQYPHFHIYNTREESLREAELRNRNKDLPVPPLPTVRK